MSLNTRVAVLLASLLVLSPLWLPLSPFAIWWMLRERRLGRAAGMAVLPRCFADAIRAGAEATQSEPPSGGWITVARNVDSYLRSIRSPRHWRTLATLGLLEFSPWLRLRPRLSRMPLQMRRNWIAKRLSTTRGLMAVPALARQLIRMGYYTDCSVARSRGFVPMRQRQRGMPSEARTAEYAAHARKRIAG